MVEAGEFAPSLSQAYPEQAWLSRRDLADRLAALATEISGLGGDAAETGDGLAIRPAALRGGLWHAYADHRMATAGAIIGLTVAGVEVDDIATTAKTMPDFPGMWARMLAS